MPILDKARTNVRETKREVVEHTLTLLNQAFALVAALAWNEAVKALIERYAGPAGAGIYSRFIYAIILTLLVVVITRYINTLREKLQKKD